MNIQTDHLRKFSQLYKINVDFTSMYKTAKHLITNRCDFFIIGGTTACFKASVESEETFLIELHQINSYGVWTVGKGQEK